MHARKRVGDWGMSERGMNVSEKERLMRARMMYIIKSWEKERERTKQWRGSSFYVLLVLSVRAQATWTLCTVFRSFFRKTAQSSIVVALLVCSRGACNAQLFVLMCALGTSSKPDVHAIAHARAHTHIHCFLPLYFTPVGINVLVHRMASMFWETFAFQMFELSHHYHLTYFSKADYLHIS